MNIQLPLRSLWLTMTVLVMAISGANTNANDAISLEASTAWLPEVEELYHADVYASQDDAVRDLTRRIIQRLAGVETSVRFVSDDPQLASAVSMRAALAGQAVDEEAETVIYIVDEPQGQRQLLKASSELPTWPQAIEVAYAETEWLLQTPPEDQVVVRGLATSGSNQDAITLAIRTQILPRLAERGHVPMDEHWQRRHCESRLRRRLERGDLIVGRFAQEFFKDIDGESHLALSREAILLDVSADKLDSLAHKLAREIRHGRRSRRSALGISVFGVAVVLLLVWCAYRILDRITQGYFTWPLRLVSAVILLIAFGAAAKIALSVLS